MSVDCRITFEVMLMKLMLKVLILSMTIMCLYDFSVSARSMGLTGQSRPCRTILSMSLT